MSQRIQKVKQHFSDNKVVYITGASCLAIGTSVGYFVAPKAIQIVDAFNIKFWSPTTSTVEQTIVLARRGHPGNIVKCCETGEMFASQNRAADLLGISKSNLSKHLKGDLPSVSGYTFENLGEAS